jgi:hypothetical protein
VRKAIADKVVERLVESLMILFVVGGAAVWDVLVSPEWNGTPIPIFLFGVIVLLLVFAPMRWG